MVKLTRGWKKHPIKKPFLFSAKISGPGSWNRFAKLRPISGFRIIKSFFLRHQRRGTINSGVCVQGTLKGEVSLYLLFDWFGLVCFANKDENCQLSYRWFQTSQTGGQQNSDTSPFSVPWFVPSIEIGLEHACFVVLVYFFPHLNMQKTCSSLAPQH